MPPPFMGFSQTRRFHLWRRHHCVGEPWKSLFGPWEGRAACDRIIARQPGAGRNKDPTDTRVQAVT